MSPFLDGDFSANAAMPIAVVGLSFRGPGDATNAENLLSMIAEGRESRQRIPKEKWNHEAFYHPEPSRNGSHNVEYAHFFKQDLTRFDAPFFNMTAAEAAALDPQQRMLLECTYEAMENSGTLMPKFVGTDTSVFVGSFSTDYADVLWRDSETVPMYQCTNAGHSRANMANRISYIYDLKGPSVTVDTACSTSLVALHLGCQSLRTGDARQAVVAGSSAMLSHEPMVTMSMMRLLSPEGRCYTFDERASGYARGDGVGVLLLKPLQAAIADGDTIRAVIRGTGSNQDGKTPGITMPNGVAQEALIRSVYKRIGLDPLETNYVECHGTGTQAGDTTETGALSRVFGLGRSAENPLVIGSVKSNIGHLEGASGVAGVIKTILMLENEIFLPNRNFQKANPRIPLDEWKLKVMTELQPWRGPQPRRASVNSFGYGGANAHVVLENAHDYLTAHGYESATRTRKSALAFATKWDVPLDVSSPKLIEASSDSEEVEDLTEGKSNGVNGRVNGATNGTHTTPQSRVFVFTAFDEAANKQQAQVLKSYISARMDIADDSFLDDLAFTLNERRTRHPWKAAVAGSSAEDLLQKLDSDVVYGRPAKKQKIGFVFTGQGAQWCGMARELIDHYPLFKTSLERSGAALKRYGAPFDLIDELTGDPELSNINRALYSQPLCSAVQIALVDLLSSWGIKPTSVTGHSSGEIAAAYVAGALSLEDAMLVAYARGVSSNELAKAGKTDGSMMAVGMSRDEILPILSSLTQGKAVVACSNSPSSLTISGDRPAIDELKDILDEKKMFARKLVVEVAYHSHHMALVAEQYRQAISGIKLLPGNEVQFFSSVTGERAAASELGPDYWVSNMVSEVKFSTSLHRLITETSTEASKARRRAKITPVETLVEIGPHSALAGPIKQIIRADEKLTKSPIDYLSALVRNKDAVETVLGLVAKLFTAGYDLDLFSVNHPTGEGSRTVLIDLPSYPWNHSNSYWAESRISKVYRNREFPRVDLLGALERNSSPLEPRWRNHIRLSELPWVRDHKIQNNIVYPAAGYIAMAIEAACQRTLQKSITNIIGYQLREVVIGAALLIPENPGEVEVAITLKSYSDSIQSPSDLWDEFIISSVSDENRWTEHCRGLISVQVPQKVSNVIDGPIQELAEKQAYAELVESYEAKCKRSLNVPQFYDDLIKLGLDYGKTFANLTSARSAPATCVGSIEIPDTAAVMPKNFEYPFVIHPATLDAFFHTIFIALAAELGELKDPAVPVSAGEIFISHDITKKPGDTLLTYTSTEQKDYRFISTTINVFDKHAEKGSKPVVAIKDLTCATLEAETGVQASDERPFRGYNFEWLPDVALLDPERIPALLESAYQPNVAIAREKMELAAFYLLNEANDVAPANDEYHKQLAAFLKSQVELALSKHVGEGWESKSAADRKQLLDEVETSSSIGKALISVGSKLPSIVKGELAPTVLLKELDIEAYLENPLVFLNSRSAASYINLLGHKNPAQSIMAVGVGSGLGTLAMLELLEDGSTLPPFSKFQYADADFQIEPLVKKKFAGWSDAVSSTNFDIDGDFDAQNVEPGSLDVLIAFHVLGTNKALQDVLTNGRKLLKPHGKLILVGRALKSLVASVLFGFIPKALSQVAAENDQAVEFDALIQESGFSQIAAIANGRNKENHGALFLEAQAPAENGVQHPKALVLVEAGPSTVSVHRLRELLSNSGISVELSTFDDAAPTREHVCIVVGEQANTVLTEPSPKQWDALKRMFTGSGGLLWVSKGGSVLASQPTANMIAGFARTVRSETGEVPLVTLDLDAEKPLDQVTAADVVAKLFNHCFSSSAAAAAEHEYAERDGIILVPRLVEDAAVSKHMAASSGLPSAELQPFNQAGRGLRMFVGTPGLLDSIYFTDDERFDHALPPDWIEIEVKASGINFKDVMMAMGQIKVENFGWECSGVVTALGSAVEGFALGDRIICHGTGTFCSNYRGPAANAQKMPDNLSFEMAAALPVTYVTAYHSIFNIARLQKGETVLIHAATGGLGQALIELCQLIGAEIFATVGTVDKKKFVMDRFSIPEDHIFFSRDGSFANGVMKMTKGKGVDAVMNSLAGESLRLSWNCIAPYGRFVELGQRDITVNSRLEMGQFIKNCSFTAFNLAYMVIYNPAVANDVFAKVMDLFAAGSIKGPEPLHVYPMSEIEKAFRTMQTGSHMGKLVVASRPGDKVKVISRDNSKNMLREDASYLLVGGLGGIGRATASWMADHGAKNLIFANRSGLKTQEAKETVALLQDKGCRIGVFSCDVTDPLAVERLVREAHEQGFPPIRGVIQGAMLLRDQLYEKLTLDDYNTVVRPKVHGTWNLHNHLPHDLDFFIMESSVSGIVGNTAQLAYAAANTFLDAFAGYRAARGLAATTLDLGAIAGVGYLAGNKELRDAMERQGFDFTDPKRLMKLLQFAIQHPRRAAGGHSHIVTGLGQYNEGSSLAALTTPPFAHFRQLSRKSSGDGANGSDNGGANIPHALRAAKSLDDAAELITAALVDRIASRSGIAAENVNTGKSMSDYGIDSLVAVEIRNWIAKEMGATVPIMELLAAEPLTLLAGKIAGRSRWVQVEGGKEG